MFWNALRDDVIRHTKKERMKEGSVKREIRVLIGNFEPNFDHMLSVIITKPLGGKYDLSVVTARDGDEVLKLAKKHSFDIFVLWLNNIIFRKRNFTFEERIENVLQIIAQLRATYEKPVIAMSTLWAEDSPYVKRAKVAGVSCYLTLPFKPEEFLEPFCRLLEIEPGGRN